MSVGLTRPSALISKAALVAVGATSLLAMTGCDTVARIGFLERDFQSVRPIGFTSVAGSCDGSSGAMRFRTVLIDSNGFPIRPDEEVNDLRVAPVEEDFEFLTGSLYATPDVECGGDGIMCEQPFTCGLGDQVATKNRCLTEANVSPTGDPTFVADTSNPQLFGVVFENSASLAGFLPAGVAELSMDFDGDGIAESEFDQSQRPGRETDPRSSRESSFTSMFTRFRVAHEYALDENRTTGFGLWTFSGTGTAGVRSLVEDLTPSGKPFTDSMGIADDARSEYISNTTPQKERASIYQAMNIVLESYADPDYANHDKTMVVFVDGYDELRSDNHTPEIVAANAAAAGVRVIIVHLDPELELETSAGTPLFRDDPDYWFRNSQPECASDADCFNYEECRSPQGYASTPMQAIESDVSGTYCLPKRNEADGRIGPIHGYSQIACETGGGYVYVPDASLLSEQMSWLPFVMDGLWELPVSLDTFSAGFVDGGESFKLATDVSISVGGTSQPYSFSEGTGDSDDTRGVVFSKP